jgi:hypothetical protein
MLETYVAPAKGQTLFFITLDTGFFYDFKFRKWCYLSI